MRKLCLLLTLCIASLVSAQGVIVSAVVITPSALEDLTDMMEGNVYSSKFKTTSITLGLIY